MTKIVVALDVPDLDRADRLGRQLAPHVSGFKVGLELLTRVGPSAVDRIASLGPPVFVDAKLHDIPTTVGRAMANLCEAGARWVTVHAGGGRRMVEEAVANTVGDAGVLAVTVLTSIDDDTARMLGLESGLSNQVARLATIAAQAGAEGLVCSAHDVASAKAVASGLHAFTPGIRLDGDNADDQSRVMTPVAAAAAGADYLVIGRSITDAADPSRTAENIAKSLAGSGERLVDN